MKCPFLPSPRKKTPNPGSGCAMNNSDLRRHRQRVLLGIPWALLTLALGGCGDSSSVAAPEPTQEANARPAAQEAALGEGDDWSTVVRSTIREEFTAIGTLMPWQRTQIGTEVSGRILEVLVDAGDIVESNQELVHLDPTFFKIQVDLSATSLEVAETALEISQLDHDRIQQLWTNSTGTAAVARSMVDHAEADLRSAGANVRAAQERLRNAEERLSRATIRAPYAGGITRRFVDNGAQVATQPPTTLLELQEIHKLKLVFALPQQMQSEVAVGAVVEFSVDGVPEYVGAGTIGTILPALEESTRSVVCVVEVDNRSLELKPGAMARVRVITASAIDAIVVPRKAVREVNGTWQVVIAEGNVPADRTVVTGLTSQTHVQIVQGLVEGDRVLLRDAGNR